MMGKRRGARGDEARGEGRGARGDQARGERARGEGREASGDGARGEGREATLRYHVVAQKKVVDLESVPISERQNQQQNSIRDW
jgi:hypothetical protein